MLGHLVFGRYATGFERSHAVEQPAEPGWMRRVLGALFGRRR